jgi:hypothetical protein
MAVSTGAALLGSAALGATGSALAGRKQAKAAEKAAGSQTQAAQEAAQVQREALESFVQRTEPFRAAGAQAAAPLAADVLRGPQLPGPELLQNPLLQAIQEDVTRRVFANQAARGRLGGMETALELQSALAPTVLNLGLGLQQQRTANLFDLTRLGSNVAAGQGTAGLSTAGGIGQALQAGGAAQAAGALGRGQAISGALGDIAGFTGFGLQGAGLLGRGPAQQFTGELGGLGGFRPTVQGAQAAGPLTASGSFFGG